jgi:hypothetical protein
MWVDGLAFAGQSGGTDLAHLTMFGRPGRPLARGTHSVVAFAAAGDDGAALIRTFAVGG